MLKRFRFLWLALLVATPALAVTWTNEVLVLASAATTIPRVQGSTGIIIQNRGPNSIFCAIGGETPVLNKSLEIKPNGSLSLVGYSLAVKCIAATADQVTGAATIVMGVP